MTHINIIGMGEIGTAIYDEIDKQLGEDTDIVLGSTEIDPKRRKELSKGKYSVSEEIPKADVHIIAVYTTEQIKKVLEDLLYYHYGGCPVEDIPLVSIESTIEPQEVKEIKKYNEELYLLLFPHRFNPNDEEHKVFNLDRVMGAFDEESLNKGLEFYSEFMDRELIHIFEPEIVALAKPLENAYRFAEIIIAQEIYLLCKEKGLDFDKVREATNSKWNINCLDAREGIGGKCLPKDIDIISEYSTYNGFFWKFLQERNKKYKYIKRKENDKNS